MVKDWSYLAAFKRKDLPSLQAMAEHISQTHDTDMIEKINQKFEDNAKSLDNGIEILDLTKTEDLVTNPGLQQCINIILGTSSSRWQYMQIGDASTPPTTADTGLGSPSSAPLRIDMSINGWIEPKGMKLFFGAIVGGTNPGITPVKEYGVFNSISSGTILNHEVFGNNTVSRNFPFVVFILSTVVEFCPVA